MLIKRLFELVPLLKVTTFFERWWKHPAHKVFLMMEVVLPNNKHIYILLWSLATFLTMQICYFISSFFGLYNSKNYIWSCTWFKILNYISGTTLITKLVIAYLKYSNSLNKVWLYIIVLIAISSSPFRNIPYIIAVDWLPSSQMSPLVIVDCY